MAIDALPALPMIIPVEADLAPPAESEAFRALLRKHEDRVYSLSLRMLGDPHDAEDVAR